MVRFALWYIQNYGFRLISLFFTWIVPKTETCNMDSPQGGFFVLHTISVTLGTIYVLLRNVIKEVVLLV